MKVAVWGAGEVGRGVAYRLVTEPHVSELHWINRSPEKLTSYAIDIRHGLAFAPSCHEVQTYGQGEVDRALERVDVLVLTLGNHVAPNTERRDVYGPNRDTYRKTVIPACRRFRGIVVVVTNPVDAMARLLCHEAQLDDRRVIGLGTLVETARVRASLADHAMPARPARDIAAFGLGTHDKDFVLYCREELGLGSDTVRVLDQARMEVAKAAERVKGSAKSSLPADRRSTLHPIAEATLAVVRAIANDSRALLTVSTLDPEDPDGLFYSVPCLVGSEGIVDRYLEVVDADGRRDLVACVEKQRGWLKPLDAG